MPGVFPDYASPIVRNGEDGSELALARWGMPSSQLALTQSVKKRAAKLAAKGKPVDFKELQRLEPDSGTTNIRNTNSRSADDGLTSSLRGLVPLCGRCWRIAAICCVLYKTCHLFLYCRASTVESGAVRLGAPAAAVWTRLPGHEVERDALIVRSSRAIDLLKMIEKSGT